MIGALIRAFGERGRGPDRWRSTPNPDGPRIVKIPNSDGTEVEAYLSRPELVEGRDKVYLYGTAPKLEETFKRLHKDLGWLLKTTDRILPMALPDVPPETLSVLDPDERFAIVFEFLYGTGEGD